MINSDNDQDVFPSEIYGYKRLRKRDESKSDGCGTCHGMVEHQ